MKIKQRASGVLLHITSLPSAYGIGDLGPEAYKFAEFLQQTEQTYWQILPLNITDKMYGNSPYSSISAFAGNIWLISPEILKEEGLLSSEDITPPLFPKNKCHYSKVYNYKTKIFKIAFQNFLNHHDQGSYENFYQENKSWLEPFALFRVLKKEYRGKIWSNWPQEIKDRNKKKLTVLQKKYQQQIQFEIFLQYIFFKQWENLKIFCNERQIKIMGDIPIYINYDSVDVWTNPEYFKLTADKQLEKVAGVPPDYFSKTGQRWGNPVYNWDKLKENKYKWWIERFSHNLKLFDLIRFDHFRGLVAYWEIPADDENAVNGYWVQAPANDFLKTLHKKIPDLKLIAEDLGEITPDVYETMEKFNLPGMRVLLFAFGQDDPKLTHLPHNYIENCLAYTGTHDNNTVCGWFKNEASKKEKELLAKYMGHTPSLKTVHLEFIQMAMSSTAKIAIFPMQDILGLGEKSRMNLPGKTNNNWQWRLLEQQLNDTTKKLLTDFTLRYARKNQ